MIVEKFIPMPEEENRGRPAKYPFSQMEVGDSVFASGESTTGRTYIAACAFGKYRGWKFSGKSVPGGVRIWRTK